MNKPERVLRMPGLENPKSSGEPAGQREFLSRGEVAKLFGVSVSTVTRWARAGLLASVRTPGGHYRYRVEDTRLAVQAAERGKEKAS